MHMENKSILDTAKLTIDAAAEFNAAKKKRQPAKNARRPRRVDFYNRADDHNCVLYASMGYSNQFIAEKTGLTFCQITYRLGRAGFTRANQASRLDFRNGRSPFNAHVLAAVKPIVDRQLVKFLNKHVGDY